MSERFYVALQEARDAALARCNAGIREMGEANEIAATRALRKGCISIVEVLVPGK